MTLRMFHLVQDQTAVALKNLAQEKMSISNCAAMGKFLKSFEVELKSAQDMYAKFKEQLDAKDPGTVAEWLQFLEQEVLLPLLPSDILAKVESITPADWLALERLIAKVVEA